MTYLLEGEQGAVLLHSPGNHPQNDSLADFFRAYKTDGNIVL